MKTIDLENIIHKFIIAANEFDVNAVLSLFATNAVIADVSVGEKFENIEGVKRYVESYFLGYHTITKLESLQHVDVNRISAKVDFTGDFGHEIGVLDLTVNNELLISHIDAYLI